MTTSRDIPQTNIQHPAYGLGDLVSYDPNTSMGVVRFPHAPGMTPAPRGLIPVAMMKLVQGKFLPLYMAGGLDD